MSSVTNEKESTGKPIDDLIVSGSTWRAIWHMSWPMMVQMFIISGASFVDVRVASELGSPTQAAIGICNQIWFLMLIMTVALSSGTMALVSRFWGARDYVSAIEAGRQSLIFGTIFGVVSTILGLIAAKPLLMASGADAIVQAQGWQYLSVDLMSQLPFTIVWTAHSMFRAIGNSRVPMMIWLVMAILIVGLDYFLCLGPPGLGVAGIGWSWCMAGVLGMCLNIYLLSRSELKESLDIFAGYRGKSKAERQAQWDLARDWLWRILKVGIPTCIQDVAWVAGNFAMFWIFACTKDPTTCQASWTIGFRLEEIISTLPLHALSASIGTIVGQNLGAGKPDRAAKSGWQATKIGFAMSIPTAAIMYFFAAQIAGAMSHDAKVIACTADYFSVMSFCMPLVACWFILFGAMSGAGYTRWPMWIGLIGLTLIRLPLAYFLATQTALGPKGIWIAISVSAAFIGIAAILRFAQGTWKKQKV